jgi:hypothetical protein
MAKNDKVDLLIKEVTVLNGKINICLSLFERLENRMIALSGVGRDAFRRFTDECKKDYEEVRDVFGSFDKEIVDILTEMDDGEL